MTCCWLAVEMVAALGVGALAFAAGKGPAMPNVTRTAPGRSDILRTWSIADSMDLYNVEQWSQGFFGMNEAGNVVVTLKKKRGHHSLLA